MFGPGFKMNENNGLRQSYTNFRPLDTTFNTVSLFCCSFVILELSLNLYERFFFYLQFLLFKIYKEKLISWLYIEN